MTSAPAEAPPPRWIAPWLALLAPLYVISPLALLGLPYLRRLPRLALWVLGFYALSQQLPALFAPEPLLASALALARTLLMGGLIGVGVALGTTARLRPFALGLTVVYVTALVFAVMGSTDFLIGRLSHPYMTPITLGLAGAFGIWIALFAGGTLLWRVPFGIFALAVLLLSGSRGPLAAALVGLLAGFLVRRKRRVAAGLVAGLLILLASFVLGQRGEVSAITRLGSADTTGRDIIWYNTLGVVRNAPWIGIGSYRLGSRLSEPGKGCELFVAEGGERAPACPEWLRSLGNPWLIAHNVTLQQLAETGPLGLLGLFTLLGTVAATAVSKRDPLGVATVVGLLVSTANDNTLLVPSPFFAELFWVVAGMQLLHFRRFTVSSGVLSTGLLLTLAFPLASLLRPPPARSEVGLSFLNGSAAVRGPADYTVFAQFQAAPGRYRAVLQSCLTTCAPLDIQPFTVEQGRSPVVELHGDLYAAARQNLELLVYPGSAGIQIQPLARRTWSVSVQP